MIDIYIYIYTDPANFLRFSVHEDCLTIPFPVCRILLLATNCVYIIVIPGYGTLNQGDSDRTADLVSVLASDVLENTFASVKIAHSIQLITIAITTCNN